MLRPGVGTFTLRPAPARMFVVLGMEVPEMAPAVPAPNWILRAMGIRLPPMARNCATPPTDVVLAGAPFGFQLATPAVKLRLARPNVARAPNAVPLPASVLGKPTSPFTVIPVPPFGLFQAGMPSHCAAAGTATQAISPMIAASRFIRILRGQGSLINDP